MLQDKYKDKEWFVKYQYNSTTKGYSPVFYSAQQVENADYSEKQVLLYLQLNHMLMVNQLNLLRLETKKQE